MNTTAHYPQHAFRRTSLFVGLLMLIVLATSACTFEVQPVEEYTSPDGYLSLTFPVSWDVLDEDASDGMTTAMVGTNEDLIEMDVIPAGEAGMGIMLMPNFMLGPNGEEMTITAEELAVLMHDGALAEQGAIGEIEAVTFSNGSQAYSFAAPSPEADMTVYVFAPADEMLTVVAVIAAPGEDNAVLLAEASEILNSVQFDGDPVEFGDRAEKPSASETNLGSQ